MNKVRFLHRKMSDLGKQHASEADAEDHEEKKEKKKHKGIISKMTLGVIGRGESVVSGSVHLKLMYDPGHLHVMVIEAKDLVAKDSSGTSDPFVILKFGKEEKKTKTIKKTLNPVYKEEQFDFKVKDSSIPMILKIRVMDWNALSLPEFMGNLVIDFTPLVNNPDKWVEKWYPLAVEKTPISVDFDDKKAEEIEKMQKETKTKEKIDEAHETGEKEGSKSDEERKKRKKEKKHKKEKSTDSKHEDDEKRSHRRPHGKLESSSDDSASATQSGTDTPKWMNSTTDEPKKSVIEPEEQLQATPRLSLGSQRMPLETKEKIQDPVVQPLQLNEGKKEVIQKNESPSTKSNNQIVESKNEPPSPDTEMQSPKQELISSEDYLRNYKNVITYLYWVLTWRRPIDFGVVCAVVLLMAGILIYLDMTFITLFFLLWSGYIWLWWLSDMVEIKVAWSRLVPQEVEVTDALDLVKYAKSEVAILSNRLENQTMAIKLGISGAVMVIAIVGHMVNASLLFLITLSVVLVLPGILQKRFAANKLLKKKAE